ncbi:hypothetical protein PV08_07006 [Exophiala spinifera]|uniref:Chromatin modification-related protein n=1 Tax=Exophiala spinifera TaxID=91928 RepID=A0A0D2BSI7_9EURO|nr:uncharacterized protein PV08_07006 [Exophiala spinifera]KIW14224.1 hypothetical protein PV08_07006 [Exophiala spinifera]
MTTTATSNIRGGPSTRRVNPGRHSKALGSSLRHNSLVSGGGLLPSSSSVLAASNTGPGFIGSEAPEIYPAITHFADAISALPREFRRHHSLLKEVDAKAWAHEESLQTVLQHCVADTRAHSYEVALAGHEQNGLTTGDDLASVSEIHSVAGGSTDAASLVSARTADSTSLQRRHLYHSLRQNLIAIMQTMDEKNHVITNANEEVTKQIRRLDTIWPHISQEISEEARLGSLTHWAYTETNSVAAKKPAEPVPRGRAGESEVAGRSQSRRDDVQAKRQRGVLNVDSDFDESRPAQRKVHGSKKRTVETAAEVPPALGASSVTATKRRKPDKPTGGAPMERSISSAMSSRAPAMSRENSQQDNMKKRKASQPTSVARKRLNAQGNDSPKLVSSPLAGTTVKEAAYKRSPALSAARPAGRGRQNSAQSFDAPRGRQSSVASSKNGNQNVTVNTSELNKVAALTGKTADEGKSSFKETKTDDGDRLLKDEPVANGTSSEETSLRGALLIERSASRQEARSDLEDVSVSAKASPRLTPALRLDEVKHERVGRGRASKTSTPVASTFADAEESESASANGGKSDTGSKSRRPARPRVKDHGLHDSLSPKGLPMKRFHKKNGSLSVYASGPGSATGRTKDENGTPLSATPSVSDKDRDVDKGGESLGLGLGLGVENEDDDAADGDGEHEDEERYCYCQGVSYGEMVACDKADCPRQWFHLECIGLKSVPKSAKWYCDECKEVLAKKGKLTNGGGSGNGATSTSASNGAGNELAV